MGWISAHTAAIPIEPGTQVLNVAMRDRAIDAGRR